MIFIDPFCFLPQNCPDEFLPSSWNNSIAENVKAHVLKLFFIKEQNCIEMYPDKIIDQSEYSATKENIDIAIGFITKFGAIRGI